MRVLVTGGGTAGHINPALAIADTIKESYPDTKFLYVGAKGGMEETLVPKKGYKFVGIEISGFKRSFSFSSIKYNVKTVKRAISASSTSKKIINKFNPDICIGTGGYVSGPIMRTAAKMKIPTIIHEQNALPGITTKMLSKYVDKVMLAMPEARKHLKDSTRCVDTGNPIRIEMLSLEKQEARKKLNLDERPVILSFGGSLGARKINESVYDLVKRSASDNKYQIIHSYGKFGKWFAENLEKDGIEKCKNLDIREYINDMPQCFMAADIVICRAGAMTISELQVCGKPSILIPSPNVAENHQYHNAMTLVKNNAGTVIEEKDLTDTIITKTVDDMLSDKKTLEIYGTNAKKMAIDDANKRVLNVFKDILKI